MSRIVHCANEDCMAIYLTPSVYEQLSSFCPVCREWIKAELAKEKNDFETELDGPSDS